MTPILALLLGILRGTEVSDLEETVKEAFGVFLSVLVGAFILVGFGLVEPAALGLGILETWNLGLFAIIVAPILASVLSIVMFLIGAILTSNIKKM